MQLERFDDFTLASAWERYFYYYYDNTFTIWIFYIRSKCKGDDYCFIFLFGSLICRFISETEAVCRQWLADGPKNLRVILLNLQVNLLVYGNE
jgi:hypothetical protein